MIDQVLKDLYNQLQVELDKFLVKGNKAAGTRARMLCQQIKERCNDIRKEIQIIKKGEK